MSAAAKARDINQNMDGMGIAELLGRGGAESQSNEPPQPALGGGSGMFSPQAEPVPISGAASTGGNATSKSGEGMSGEDYINLASSLGTIAASLAQPTPAPPGAPIPQPGPTNFQPTALAMLARRRF